MYPVRGYVKVSATGATGRVVERHEATRKYLVEFNRNLSTRQLLTESELAGVSAALSSSAGIPSNSSMLRAGPRGQPYSPIGI